MSRLWPYFRRFVEHRIVLAGLACVPLASVGEIAMTLVIANALDRLKTADDVEFLRGFFLLVVAIAATRGLFRFLHRWWVVGVSRRVEVALKQDLFDHLVRLPHAFHDRQRSGEVVSRLTSDVENVRMLLGPGVMYVAGALVIVPGSLIAIALRVSPTVALVLLPPLLLVVFFMRKLTPRMHEHSAAVQESLAGLSHRAQETFAGMRVVKGYGLEPQRDEAFSRDSAENRGHQIELARARGWTHSLVNLGHQLAYVPILFVGGLAMIDRSIDIGGLFTAVDLTTRMFWPLIALGRIAGLYPRALASAERLDEIFAVRPDITDPDEPVPLPEVLGALTFRNVGFTYEGAERAALEGVNVQVPAGGTLGVVGPTGSGKSTLLSLLGRLYEPRGELRLDGIDVSALSLTTLRDAFGYVPQDGFLFSDTYRENVSFGVDELLDDDAMADVLERAALTEEVAAFPSGYDQIVGERGVTLSGGQRQRTCIARALARDPKVLVLDDTLSAVDTDTEARLLASLREAGEGRTVVVAAHRLASVRAADEILVLDGGRVAAQGTHAELLDSSDWYRRTWERQRMAEELSEL